MVIQALLLKRFLFLLGNKKEVVVMVIQSFLLKSSPLLLGREGVVDMAIQIMIFEGFPLLLGKGSGCGHCHTSLSYKAFF